MAYELTHMNEVLKEIALEEFGIKTFEMAGSDSMDFIDVHIHQIQKALKRAYAEGYDRANKDWLP
jgi:hypothetical protein